MAITIFETFNQKAPIPCLRQTLAQALVPSLVSSPPSLVHPFLWLLQQLVQGQLEQQLP